MFGLGRERETETSLLLKSVLRRLDDLLARQGGPSGAGSAAGSGLLDALARLFNGSSTTSGGPKLRDGSNTGGGEE